MRLDIKYQNLETTGHPTNMVTTIIDMENRRIELTYYEDGKRYGSEIYFLRHSGFFYKSFNYSYWEKLPKKYLPYVQQLKKEYDLYYNPPVKEG